MKEFKIEKPEIKEDDINEVFESLDGELYLKLGIVHTRDGIVYITLKKINDTNSIYYYTEEEISNFNLVYKITEKSKKYKDEHKEEINKMIEDYKKYYI